MFSSSPGKTPSASVLLLISCKDPISYQVREGNSLPKTMQEVVFQAVNCRPFDSTYKLFPAGRLFLDGI